MILLHRGIVMAGHNRDGPDRVRIPSVFVLGVGGERLIDYVKFTDEVLITINATKQSKHPFPSPLIPDYRQWLPNETLTLSGC